MNRQRMVVLVVVAVMGIGALVILTVDFRGSDPALQEVPVSTPPAPETPDPAVAPTPPPPAVARPTRPLPSAVPASPTPSAVPAPLTTATLRIATDVPNAQVFIDRRFIGIAPVTAEDVAPGLRTINISAPGYDGVAETLDVSPGPRDVVISLKTIRLDESIDVIHKHGIGSCAGRLVAAPEGLRYDTDNKNDGFFTPLGALETFDADFLAKNLKVKIKGGRTYNFTDPGGKADPLYLFHQAVDKVRRRMEGGGR